MMERGRHLVMTNDMNRPYRDIIERRGNWVMEDWLRWMEIYSRYVMHMFDGTDFFPVVERKGKLVSLRQVWFRLRDALAHHFRYGPDACDAGRRKQAQLSLLIFSRHAEDVFGLEFCTPNLHILNCALPDSERALGHLSFYSELWVERAIQDMKSNVKFRTTGCPEMLYMSELLSRERLGSVRAADPKSYPTFDEWVPEYRSAERTMRNEDDGANAEGTQLLGGGRVVDPERDEAERMKVFAAISMMLKDCGIVDERKRWDDDWRRPTAHMVAYTYACKGDEVILSEMY